MHLLTMFLFDRKAIDHRCSDTSADTELGLSTLSKLAKHCHLTKEHGRAHGRHECTAAYKARHGYDYRPPNTPDIGTEATKVHHGRPDGLNGACCWNDKTLL